MKCKHKTLIFLAGFVWLCAGVMLLTMGIRFLLETVRNPLLCYVPGSFSISNFFGKFVTDKTQAVLLVLLLALTVGYMKGRVMLAKAVKRQVTRIRLLPNPASLRYLYSKGYFVLIAVMALMGALLRVLPITLDTRGFVDVIIGAALINGSMLFFRACVQHPVNEKI